jgi:hypothetical protein
VHRLAAAAHTSQDSQLAQAVQELLAAAPHRPGWL